MKLHIHILKSVLLLQNHTKAYGIPTAKWNIRLTCLNDLPKATLTMVLEMEHEASGYQESHSRQVKSTVVTNLIWCP